MEEEKISQEETQNEEVRAGDEPEVAEGYSHLTQEDLDPDYQPTEKEAETKEVEDVQADTSENVKQQDKVEESPSKEEEYQINGTTYKADELQERMVKDYKNLASHTGKQAEEIGKYKAEIEELRRKVETPPNAESDIYGDKKLAGDENIEKKYDIFTEEGIKELSRDIALNTIQQSQKELETKQQKQTVEQIAKDASDAFIESHSLNNDSYVTELVEYAKETGFQLQTVDSVDQVTNYLEHLHAMKTGDYSQFSKQTKEVKTPEPDTKVDSSTMEKVSEGQKVQKGLGNVNSSESDNVDYDNMNFDDWAKLPKEKRNQLLGIN
tara:strand:+ start:5395 stop:6366 length:972 start_codon:yes stop_codon:yes gene_type:complete